MRFFLDHCVPRSVGVFLESRGHEVIYLQAALPKDADDHTVAAVAQLNDAILVSFDKDMKGIAKRMGISDGRFRKLSRISFQCEMPKAAARIADAINLIEFEFDHAQSQPDKRLFVIVQGLGIRTIR